MSEQRKFGVSIEFGHESGPLLLTADCRRSAPARPPASPSAGSEAPEGHGRRLRDKRGRDLPEFQRTEAAIVWLFPGAGWLSHQGHHNEVENGRRRFWSHCLGKALTSVARHHRLAPSVFELWCFLLLNKSDLADWKPSARELCGISISTFCSLHLRFSPTDIVIVNVKLKFLFLLMTT